jgi:hypothetical protein
MQAAFIPGRACVTFDLLCSLPCLHIHYTIRKPWMVARGNGANIEILFNGIAVP